MKLFIILVILTAGILAGVFSRPTSSTRPASVAFDTP